MQKKVFPAGTALYPTPVVLVSCIDTGNSRNNIVTVAWCGIVCSEPPLISISLRPSRHSNRLIRETGDFVVNIPSKGLAEKADHCGIVSGSDTDKFKSRSFTADKSSKVASPLIRECPVNIECILKKILSLGTHDMFIGEVVAVHADEDVLNDKGSIDYQKASPFVYNQGEYWDLSAKIGNHGYSRR